MTADGQGMGLKRHAIAVPPEALEAWTYYDPPQFKHESGRIRDAFLSGWLARTIPAQPSSADEEAVERGAKAFYEFTALQINKPDVIPWAALPDASKNMAREATRAAISAMARNAP